MTVQIKAIYENGVFRPIEPVLLTEGERVDLSVITQGPEPDPQRLAAPLEAIAAMPSEGPNDGFSGADHDKVLYGEKGAW